MPNPYDVLDTGETFAQANPYDTLDQAATKITVGPSGHLGFGDPRRSAAALNVYEALKQIQTEGLGAIEAGAGNIASGARQLISPSGADRPRVVPTPIPQRLKAVGDILGGILGTTGGAIEYGTSPLMAPVRAFATQPLENVIGVPREYTEFAASLAAPLPRQIPRAPARTPSPTVEELGKEASQFYKAPEVVGTELTAPARQAFGREVARAFEAQDVTPRASTEVRNILDRFTAEGGPVTANKVERLRQELGEIQPTRDVTGAITNAPEMRAAAIAREAIDNLLPETAATRGEPAAAARTLAQARANEAAKFGAETINRQEFRAELRAAAANSGQNISNTMRSRIADILINPVLRRGYSQEELALMDRIVRGGTTENLVRGASNILGGGGGMHSYIAGFTTAGIAPGIGYGLKKLSNRMTMQNIDRLNEMIRADSPLGRRIGAQLQDWGEIARSAEANPSPATIARLTLASRNLSNNLADAGINITAENLLRSLVPGAPREEAEQ